MKAFLAERFTPHYLRNLLLGLVLVFSLISGADAIVQGLPADQLWLIGAVAFLVGWLFYKILNPALVFALIASIFGFAFVFFRVGRLASPAWFFLQRLYDYLYLAAQNRFFPDPADMQTAWLELTSGASVLFGRLFLWLRQVSLTDPIYDPFVLALVWGLFVWGLSIWAGWALRRDLHPAAAAAPSIFVLGYSLAFVGGPASHLTPMLAVLLLLTIFNSHDNREERWLREGARFPHSLRRNVAWMALLLTAVLATTASVMPSISLQDISDFIRDLTRGYETDLEESLGLNPAPEPVRGAVTLADLQSTRLSGIREGGLPRQHLIGSGPELSEQIVMVIAANELIPLPGGGGIEQVPRSETGYYWRSLTYDHYNGQGWFTREIEVKSYQSGELAVTTSLPGQHILRQQVSLSEQLGGLVYVAGDLITTDRFFSTAIRPSTSVDGVLDIFGATLDSPVYQADSLLFNFSPQELRTASGIIPQPISDTYLDLPRSIPDRVLQKAYELTATQPTMFDRALAIESYLRTFEYDLSIPPPPFGEDVDLVDYFLFTLQRGYCDYYATAMVVLARAAGLPARFVQGYIGGTYDPTDQLYLVTEDQAHSWAEIYFPGYGWIGFEPTAGRPRIDRPIEPLPDIPPDFDPEAGFIAPIEDELPIIDLRVDARSPWLRLTLSAIGVALVLALVWPTIDLWRLRLLPPRMALVTIFTRLYRSGRSLRIPGQEGQTPLEFARHLSARLGALLEGRRNALDHNATADILWLSDEYARYRYSQYDPDARVRSRAVLAWRGLRRLLLSARWRSLRIQWPLRRK